MIHRPAARLLPQLGGTKSLYCVLSAVVLESAAKQMTKSLFVILLMPALAISYYFAISLPNHNNSLLELERQKYADQKAKEQELKLKSEKEANMLTICISNAENAYDVGLKQNGTPTKSGGYSVPVALLNALQRKRETDIDNCHKSFKP